MASGELILTNREFMTPMSPMCNRSKSVQNTADETQNTASRESSSREFSRKPSSQRNILRANSGSNDPKEIIRNNQRDNQRDPDKSTSKMGGGLPQNKYTRVVQRSSSKQMDAVLLRRNSSAVVNVKKSLGFSESSSKNLISRNSSSSSLK